ncbi:MAG TPA: hypothetical protein VEL75_04185 [Candidatus Methylomirabilis sp.]|nr:hypothetical protein [Candidatus Methylomirabilis sp.]
MKAFHAASIAVLALLSALLYFRGARQVESLSERIRALESTSAQQRSDYETAIARLKAELAAARPPAATPGENPLLSALLRAQGSSASRRDAVLPEMTTALGLDPTQQARVREVVDAFGRARAAVFARAQTEQRSVLEPRNLDTLNQARAQALADLRRVLTEPQYKAFIARDLDRALGLRIVGSPESARGPGG